MKRTIKTLTSKQLETIRRESEQWLTDTMAKIKQCDANRQKRTGKEQSVSQATTPELTPEYYDYMKRKEADAKSAKKRMWHECEKH